MRLNPERIRRVRADHQQGAGERPRLALPTCVGHTGRTETPAAGHRFGPNLDIAQRDSAGAYCRTSNGVGCGGSAITGARAEAVRCFGRVRRFFWQQFLRRFTFGPTRTHPSGAGTIAQISQWNKPMNQATLSPDGHAVAFVSPVRRHRTSIPDAHFWRRASTTDK